MGDSRQADIDAYLPHLHGLIQRGRKLCGRLAADPSDQPALAATRIWQQDCALTINQLSGGSKAHWLARAYSEAFLMRSRAGEAVEAAAPDEIAGRVIHVLEQAVGSLSQMREGETVSASPAAEPPHRFDFVHNSELRPVAEQAYSDGRRALEEGRFDAALLTFCGILEAIVTDALEHKGVAALAAAGVPAGAIADWPFEARLAAAEKAGIIHGECARLPPIARRYRDLMDAGGERVLKAAVSERDARQTGQVLRVVMRDLDPGR